jgi:hypothetical protein
VLCAACGSDKNSLVPDDPDGPTGDATGAPPSLGAHAIVFQRLNGGLATIATPALATSASGSTMIVSVGRGDFGAFTAPSDNKGNSYTALGMPHVYTRYPNSGTALYAVAGATGGPGHVISATTPPSDEITLAVVEVRGRRVQDFKWSEVLMDKPLTSQKVTTTGPATLVAFWWGDAGVDSDKTATPNNGFAVVDAVLSSGALVQASVAVKAVTAAGSYDVTWTATPRQGAQLWIAAIGD